MKERNKGKKCKECGSEAVCKGYCRKHYGIAKRNGLIEVKNLSCLKIYGVGVNDMPRGWAKRNQRIYAVWYEMIRRCYSEE